jgi:hypothetical protein
MYLYVGLNGCVAAIDPQSGNEVWRAELPSGGFFYPCKQKRRLRART